MSGFNPEKDSNKTNDRLFTQIIYTTTTITIM